MNGAPFIARLAASRASPLALGEDLLVLAPHPDDETLGCGGTIHRARAAGARVTIAFLTDGADSHLDFVPAAELREVRRAEAVAAAKALGVGAEGLCFLDYADGRLGEFEASARARLLELAAERRPSALLAPCPWDVSSDHLVASRLAAGVAADMGVPVHGYATWFWDRWPWTTARASSTPRTLARAAAGAWRLLRRFRTAVPVGDVLDVKRRALAEHRTQVERRDGNPAWPVLGDVSGGRFLELLLTDWELFATSTTTGR